MFGWIIRNKNNSRNLEKRYADFLFHANVKSSVDSKWSVDTFKNAIIVFLEKILTTSSFHKQGQNTVLFERFNVV